MSRPASRTSRSSSPPALFAPSTASSSGHQSAASTTPPPAVIDGALAKWQQLGLHLRRSYVQALARHIHSSSPASLASVDAFTKAAYPYILSSSFSPITRPSLPANLASAHHRRLPSQYILLVLSSLNTLSPPSAASSQAPSTRRLLKLTLTDGWQMVAGMEVKGGVASLPPAGTRGYKVAVRDVEVWRGVLLLDDTNTTCLGGEVRGDEEEAQALVAADAGDGKGTDEYKQPPPAAPPYSATASVATRPAPIPVSHPPRPPPAIAPYAAPRYHTVPLQPNFSTASSSSSSSPLPLSMPPLEPATQPQSSNSRTSPRGADERKMNSGARYAADDGFDEEDERMHDFYAPDDAIDEDALIRLSAESDSPAAAPHTSPISPSQSPPPLLVPSPAATTHFVRASSIQPATANRKAAAAAVSFLQPTIQPSSSSLLSASAVVDAPHHSAFRSAAINTSARPSVIATHVPPLAVSHAPPPLLQAPRSANTGAPAAVPLAPPSNEAAAASVLPRAKKKKEKPGPHVDDPFYLPATALSQDDLMAQEEEEEDEEEEDSVDAQSEQVKSEQRSQPNDRIDPHTVSPAAVVDAPVEPPVAMIEHDISGPEELAEAHHYLMQAEARDKQKQASDSLPPLEEVDDYYETKEDPTAALEQPAAAVDVIALDDSDDDVLEAPSSGTSNSSPPTLASTASTPRSTALVTADCPFTYIHSLLRLLPQHTGPPRLFVIKGYLVTNSNSVTFPAFAMHVLVDDGSGCVECAMDGALLESSVFQCTPQQLLAMSADEQARLLKEAEKRVVLMEGFMLLRVAAGSLPLVLSVHEPDALTVAAVMEQRERER